MTALRDAGVVAADEEFELFAAAANSNEELTSFVRRRAAGEPPAWIVGHATFAGIDLVMAPGVYVPRWKTEAVARHALTYTTDGSVIVDLCTGSGAIAAFLARSRPAATVIATEVDAGAAACARANGVHVSEGDLFDPLPRGLRGRVDVVVAVPPYVPSEAMEFLPADIRRHEPPVALDGGRGGLVVFDRIVSEAPGWLRPDGSLVVEVGMGEVPTAAARLRASGFADVGTIVDQDRDPTGVCGRFPAK